MRIKRKDYCNNYVFTLLMKYQSQEKRLERGCISHLGQDAAS